MRCRGGSSRRWVIYVGGHVLGQRQSGQRNPGVSQVGRRCRTMAVTGSAAIVVSSRHPHHEGRRIQRDCRFMGPSMFLPRADAEHVVNAFGRCDRPKPSSSARVIEVRDWKCACLSVARAIAPRSSVRPSALGPDGRKHRISSPMIERNIQAETGKRSDQGSTVSTRMVILARMMITVWSTLAAEVTSDRLANADKEPQNG